MYYLILKFLMKYTKMKLTFFKKNSDRILVRELEIDTESENPDVELNVLFDTEILDEINKDEVNFLLKKLGYYDDYKKRQSNVP